MASAGRPSLPRPMNNDEGIELNNSFGVLSEENDSDCEKDLDLGSFMDVNQGGRKRAMEEVSGSDEERNSGRAKGRRRTRPEVLEPAVKVVSLNGRSSEPIEFGGMEEKINYGNILIIENVQESQGLPIRSSKFRRDIESSEITKAGIVNMKVVNRIGGVAIEVRKER